MQDFKTIEWQGLWDMPSRKGETVYDWGDELQPLTDDEDIVWNSRNFTLRALFDKRILGNDFEQKKAKIAALGKFTLSTPFRDCEVWVEEFRILSENSISAICEFKFYEQSPRFEAVLPTPSNYGSTIDGYSLYKDLGIYFVFNDDKQLAKLKDLGKTVFNKGKGKSEYREFPEVTLNCFSKDVSKIQKILSKSGLRELRHKGKTYKCFFTKGFKINKRTNGFIYEIKLSVSEII